MDRNNNERFSQYPSVELKRSVFKRPSEHKTTFNAGDLIPIYLTEYVPGQTITMDMSAVVRSVTPIVPVMDDAFIDIFWFSVPYRLVWQDTKHFFGESNQPWFPTQDYFIPSTDLWYANKLQNVYFDAPVKSGDVGDYFGLPVISAAAESLDAVHGPKISLLPGRAYSFIWNEWFRDQNVMPPDYFTTSSVPEAHYNNALFKKPLKVSKFHDYFTSALPSPQKSAPVTIPFDQKLPVYAETEDVPYKSDYGFLRFKKYGLEDLSAPSGSLINSVTYGVGVDVNSGTTGFNNDNRVKPSNLWADANYLSINVLDLRKYTSIQRFFEKDAVSGTRYQEIIKGHFGVDSPDARVQIPEYLGGTRVPIQVNQVLQNSATPSSGDSTPLGSTGAYSLTGFNKDMFTKSFTEFGMLIGLACVRTNQTYQNCIDRFWRKSDKFDFYWPEFNGLGEQEILNTEIFLSTTQSNADKTNDEIFGYQERYAEYKYKPSIVTGQFRSDVDNSLDVWHYANDFSKCPVLNMNFISQSPINVDRTLAIKSDVSNQYYADFAFIETDYSPMPLHSIPGIGSSL